ncbi:MAG: LLM class flavin-dependent oxidoreductase [Acidimicrobiales bacterium]|jgi:alkanesulfonate monooxygenase SsuD/methylene tetrahydromethanopterin reductase-like flavin-dependent oxidoreductase (luciferase family)
MSRPFARGSISLRLYPHNDLDAKGIVRELCEQAVLGLAGGFDGVMTSEHHGGFAGYLPNPLQMASFVLEEHPTGWAAAGPLLLPLRPVAQMAEEVAWLAARHPGRVGLGVAAGALPLDFEVMEVAQADAVPRFVAGLPRIVALLEGRDLGLLGGDRALQACVDDPVPVLSAAASTGAARRAAACGAGILCEGMSDVGRLRRICDAYDTAGGGQAKVMIRRVWLGEPRGELIERQRGVYDSYSARHGGFPADQTIADADPERLAGRIVEAWRGSGADAVDLRVHLPGVTPAEARAQITALADAVLPPLRASWEQGAGA